MMAMMASMTGTPKSGGDDCNSSVDDNDMTSQDMTSHEYNDVENHQERMNVDGSHNSEDEAEGDDFSAVDIDADDDMNEELPTQVKVR